MRDRSRKDIGAFLSDLRKRQGIADWRVRQAEHALRIFHKVFLPHYVPEKRTVMQIAKTRGIPSKGSERMVREERDAR